MAKRQVPTPVPETIPFWTAAKERKLVVQWCSTCAEHYFYPRSRCQRCGSADVEWRQVSGRGKLISYVINYRPLPPSEDGSPQVIALVQLDEGVRMLTNIVGSPAEPEALVLDAPVMVDFEPCGEWQLPVFRMAEAQ